MKRSALRGAAVRAIACAIACAAAFLLFLAGCATTGEPGGSDLTAVTTLLEKASPSALKEAALALSAPGSGGPDTPSANLSGLGRELYAALYPRMRDNPFPGDAVTPVYGPLFTTVRSQTLSLPKDDEKDFFALIIPCLILLDGSVPIPQADLDALQAVVEKADGQTGRMSVIPPYLLGLISERRSPDDSASALSLYRESVARDQSFFPGREKVAILLVASKQPEEAVAILEELSASVPQDASILKVLARAYLDAGRLEKAMDTAGRALVITPDDSDLALIRARAFQASGDWYQALRVLDLLLKRSPDAKEGILEKADMLARSAGNLEEAMEALEDARARFPTDPDFPELEGKILAAAGHTDEGVKALEAALEIQPNRASVLRALLGAYVQMEEWPEAGELLDRVLAFDDSDPTLQLAFRTAWNLGEMDKAAEYAKTLVDRNTTWGMRLNLAQALHALGKDEDALLQAQTGIAEAKTPAERSGYLTVIASIKEAAGDTEGAISDLRSAIREYQDNVDALIQLSELMVATGRLHDGYLFMNAAAMLSPEKPELAAKARELDQRAADQAAMEGTGGSLDAEGAAPVEAPAP